MKGVSKRTTKLGFHVLRLHYTADPDKDPSTEKGRKWYEEARKGMSDQRWRQEHELDYGALGGQLVFPIFDESIHVVQPKPWALKPELVTIWLGADPHPRTPHAFLWLAIDKDGEMAVVNSWWADRDDEHPLLVKDYAAELKRIHKDLPGLKPRREVMDVAGANFNADEEHNYFQAYQKEGIYFQPAKRNRDLSGYDLIAAALTPRPVEIDGKVVQLPRLTIWDGCGDNAKLVWQLKNLRYREWKGNVTDKDAPEEPMQKERHLIDCLSYILLDQPRFMDPHRHRGGDGGWKPIYGGSEHLPGGTAY